MKRHTLNELRVDIEAAETIEEYGKVLRSGVCRSRVGDWRRALLRGDCTFARQSSASPVAPE